LKHLALQPHCALLHLLLVVTLLLLLLPLSLP
jgi:hypothetical protein